MFAFYVQDTLPYPLAASPVFVATIYCHILTNLSPIILLKIKIYKSNCNEEQFDCSIIAKELTYLLDTFNLYFGVAVME